MQFDVPGAYFLDLFAGSGQIGLEALSRGAAYAVFVEKDVYKRQAIRDTLQPVYSVTRGVTNNLIVKTIKETLSHDTLLSDYLRCV